MKLLFLTFIAAVLFGSVSSANAQTESRQITLRVGNQKKESRSNLTIKFLSVLEDSRCPEGVTCVWAGNARIKVAIIESGREVKTAELNTNLGPKGDTQGAYAFYLTSLTPTPKASGKTNAKDYVAIFSISRLTR